MPFLPRPEKPFPYSGRSITMTRRSLKATRSDLTCVKNGIARPTKFTSVNDIWKIETIVIDRITDDRQYFADGERDAAISAEK